MITMQLRHNNQFGQNGNCRGRVATSVSKAENYGNADVPSVPTIGSCLASKVSL